jgi:hypothetical protein
LIPPSISIDSCCLRVKISIMLLLAALGVIPVEKYFHLCQ